jgi:hypothetical protein
VGRSWRVRCADGCAVGLLAACWPAEPAQHRAKKMYVLHNPPTWFSVERAGNMATCSIGHLLECVWRHKF